MARNQPVRFLSDGNPLMILMVLQISFFALVHFIQMVYLLGNQTQELFISSFYNKILLPASFTEWLRQPWTLFTHLFVQQSIWQLIGNLLFLWSFGYLLQDLTGNKQLVPLFLYGGLAGTFFFIGSVHLIPRFAPQADFLFYSGPGAGIMAIALGVTTIAPGYRIFPMINGGIPLWVLTLLYVLIDFAGLATTAFPYHLAHLAGALIGFIYIKGIQKGMEPGAWMHRVYYFLIRLFTFKRKQEWNRSLRETVFYQSGNTAPYKKITERTEKRIDALLDKINRTGFDSLSKEEKDFLNRAGDSNNE